MLLILSLLLLLLLLLEEEEDLDDVPVRVVRGVVDVGGLISMMNAGLFATGREVSLVEP